jgi:hypothetical protein
MELKERLIISATFLVAVLFFYPPTSGATGLSLSVALLGEPDVFVPGVGLSAEIPLTRSLGLFAGGAYFLSGTWDMALGVSWHTTPRFALKLQALFLFDVIDGFVPQVGGGMRFSFPLSRSFTFFNELYLNVPLVERFLQPAYAAGFALTF